MASKTNLNPQYVTDNAGHKTAVILSIDEYNELLEDLHDLAAIAERKTETSIPHEKVVKELKDDGYLSD